MAVDNNREGSRHYLDGVAGLEGHVLAVAEGGGLDVGGLAVADEADEAGIEIAGVLGGVYGFGQGQVFGPGNDGVADLAGDGDDFGLGTGLFEGLLLAFDVGLPGLETGAAFCFAAGGEGKEQGNEGGEDKGE